MRWETHTINTIRKLYNDEAYRPWSDSIENGTINDFSEELNELLARLAGLVISEFEVSADNREKLIKIMELAAVAGREI